jgi:hypothetical protein
MPSYYNPDDIARFITGDPDKFDEDHGYGEEVESDVEFVNEDTHDDGVVGDAGDIGDAGDDGAQEPRSRHQRFVEELEASRFKSDMVEIYMRTDSVCFIVAYADEVKIDHQWVQVLNDSGSVFAHDGISVHHVSYIAPHMH